MAQRGDIQMDGHTENLPTPMNSFVYLNPMLRAQTDVFIKENTVESRYNGPANNGNPLITENILQTLGKFFSIFYIGNNRNLPVEDDNGWSLQIC